MIVVGGQQVGQRCAVVGYGSFVLVWIIREDPHRVRCAKLSAISVCKSQHQHILERGERSPGDKGFWSFETIILKRNAFLVELPVRTREVTRDKRQITLKLYSQERSIVYFPMS